MYDPRHHTSNQRRPIIRKYMKYVIVAALLLVTLVATGCASKADKVSTNLSRAAENFQIQRRIIAINGITDKVLFEVEGRCSLETSDSKLAGTVEITCKHGPHDFRKHYIGLSDNVTFVSAQVKGFDVSEYRTRIIIKPQDIVPDLDLVTGETP